MAATYFCGTPKLPTPPQSSRNTNIIGEHEEHQHYWRTRLSGNTSIFFRHPPWVFSDTLFAVDRYSDASNRALGSVVMPYDPAATETPRGPSYWFSKTGPNAGLIYQKYGHELSVKLLTLTQILGSLLR